MTQQNSYGDEWDSIARYFQNDVLEAFEDDALASFECVHFSAPLNTKPEPNRSIINIGPDILLRLFPGSSIKYIMTKRRYGADNQGRLRSHYVFPDKASISLYLSRMFVGDALLNEARIVNQSWADIDAWVEDLILQAKQSSLASTPKTITVLAGGIGTGKSTFNKMVGSLHHGQFRDQRVVYSRIEQKKLFDFIDEEGVFLKVSEFTDYEKARHSARTEIRKVASRFIIAAIARDLFYSIFMDQYSGDDPAAPAFAQRERPFWPELDVTDLSNFKGEFVNFFSGRFGAGKAIDLNQVANTLAQSGNTFRKHDPSQRLRWIKTYARNSDFRLAFRLLLVFASERHGIRFVTCYDGFDYIQAADFAGGSKKALLFDELSEWISESKGDLRFDSLAYILSPAVQLTVRNCTLAILSARNLEVYGHHGITKLAIVGPPSAPRLVSKIISSALDNSSKVKKRQTRLGMLKIFKLVRGALAEQFLNNDELVNFDVFQGNTRHFLTFMHCVLKEICYLYVKRYGTTEPIFTDPDRTKSFSEFVENFVQARRYRIVEQLLHADNPRYGNFLTVDKPNRWLQTQERTIFLSEKILKPNDSGSGFVANVFSYHIRPTKYSELGWYLEKIHILLVLAGCSNLRTLPKEIDFEQLGTFSRDDIAKRMARAGWECSPYFDLTLSIAVREHFASLHATAGLDSATYGISPFGWYVLKTFLPSMTYLENIYFGLPLPNEIRRSSKNIIRNPTPETMARDWVSACIFHTHTLLRIVKSAERHLENKNSFSVYEHIAEGVRRDIKKIERSQRSMGGRYLNEFNDRLRILEGYLQ